MTCTFNHTLFTLIFYLSGYIKRPAKRCRTETTTTPSTSLTPSITPSTLSTTPSTLHRPSRPIPLLPFPTQFTHPYFTPQPTIHRSYLLHAHPSPPVYMHALANSLHPHRLPCGHHTHLHASPLHLFTLYHDHPLTH